jgi:hypothetical protein
MRPSRLVYVLPALHFFACLLSYIGLVIPSLQFLGILFSLVLVADLPVSLPTYALGWKYSALAATWIFVAGTLWWYLLSRGAAVLLNRFSRRDRSLPD